MFRSILISQLRLDSENPRLPERLKTSNTSESDVLNWMLEDATLVDLIASIAENGFFLGEPIIAIQEGRLENYIVIEGNRRLAALKLLQNPSIASISFKTVSELSRIAWSNNRIPLDISVYLASDRDSVDNYLGFRHVTGVKQWPTISKARYLYRLFKKKDYYDGIFRELAREIGSKSPYVKRLVYGYELFSKIKDHNYYGLDLDEESFDLSRITDAAIINSNIASYMGFDSDNRNPSENLNEEKFKQVVEWLYKVQSDGTTRVGESRNIRVLNKVLGFSRATTLFVEENKSLREAAQFTDLMDESIREFLQSAYNNLIEAQKQTHLADNPIRQDIQLLDDIVASAEFIQSHLRKVLRSKQVTQA